MDKTIVKALFKEIACKNPVRPSLMGVHFEENRCYATDTHILVVYNESDQRFAGKTLSIDGKEIVGKYLTSTELYPKTCQTCFGETSDNSTVLVAGGVSKATATKTTKLL